MKRFLFIVALGTVYVACLSMERVPTAADIREWPALEPFVLRATDITGVYQNIDVDCVVFHYRSSIHEESKFWYELRQQAHSAGWIQIDERGLLGRSQGYEVFQRLKPKGSLWFSSAEELRVAYMPDRVVIAYVQSDQDGDPKPVHQASEGRFRRSAGLASVQSARAEGSRLTSAAPGGGRSGSKVIRNVGGGRRG